MKKYFDKIELGLAKKVQVKKSIRQLNFCAKT